MNDAGAPPPPPTLPSAAAVRLPEVTAARTAVNRVRSEGTNLSAVAAPPQLPLVAAAVSGVAGRPPEVGRLKVVGPAHDGKNDPSQPALLSESVAAAAPRGRGGRDADG